MGKGYEKRCKVTRIFLADYLLLKDLSNKAGISMAEALNKVLTRDWAATKSAQIPMPVTMAQSIPVTRARSTPVTRARSTPVTISFAREVKSVTNGHRQAD